VGVLEDQKSPETKMLRDTAYLSAGLLGHYCWAIIILL